MSADIHTLTGAYALDALSDPERRAFEEHMGACPSCADEVAELRDTAARLGAAVATDPPPALRGRVLEEVARTRQLLPLVEPGRSRRRSRLLGWPAQLSLVAAAASVVVAVLLGVAVARDNQQLRGELDQARAELAHAEQVRDVLAAPDATLVHGRLTTGGAAAVVASRLSRAVLVFTEELPPLPESRTYQLWLIGPQGARPAGLLRAGDGPVLARDDGSATDVGLTVEPEGGSAQPTTNPVLVISLPR